jgi:hypothetical protein
MLVDIASFEDITFERALRHYTQFRGEDGRSREAESIDAMSEAWVARTIGRAEPDWKAIPLRPGPGHRAAVLPAKEVAS